MYTRTVSTQLANADTTWIADGYAAGRLLLDAGLAPSRRMHCLPLQSRARRALARRTDGHPRLARLAAGYPTRRRNPGEPAGVEAKFAGCATWLLPTEPISRMTAGERTEEVRISLRRLGRGASRDRDQLLQRGTRVVPTRYGATERRTGPHANADLLRCRARDRPWLDQPVLIDTELETLTVAGL